MWELFDVNVNGSYQKMWLNMALMVSFRYDKEDNETIVSFGTVNNIFRIRGDATEKIISGGKNE